MALGSGPPEKQQNGCHCILLVPQEPQEAPQENEHPHSPSKGAGLPMGLNSALAIFASAG